MGLKSPENCFYFFIFLIPLHDMGFFVQRPNMYYWPESWSRSSSDADAVAAARATSCLRHTHRPQEEPISHKLTHKHFTHAHTQTYTPPEEVLDFNATSGCHIECGSVCRGGGSGGSGGSGARGRQKRLWSQRQQRRQRRRQGGKQQRRRQGGKQQRRRRRRRAGEGWGRGERSGLGFWT
jgi:hypothetical protein